MWRTVYLAKLPRWSKKLRVVVDWTLDLLFGREIEQMVTLRDVELLADRVLKFRSRAKELRH
jgi:spore coat polysaccharide biosynthesis protein SpsF (cytidylyltransferase family)